MLHRNTSFTVQHPECMSASIIHMTDPRSYKSRYTSWVLPPVSRTEDAEEHITRHLVEPHEVEEALYGTSRYLTSGRCGTRLVFGATASGRYLFVVVAEALDGGVSIVTVGDLAKALLSRMDAAGDVANVKVLLHRKPSRAVIDSRNYVAVAVVDFQERLGIERDRRSLDARRWADAAAEVRERAFGTGKAGVDAIKVFGKETVSGIGSAAGKVSVDLIKGSSAGARTIRTPSKRRH